MQAHSDHSDEPGACEVEGRLRILQKESWCFLEEALVLQSGVSCQPVSLTFHQVLLSPDCLAGPDFCLPPTGWTMHPRGY